jgi:hypothetical protein
MPEKLHSINPDQLPTRERQTEQDNNKGAPAFAPASNGQMVDG